MPFTYAELEQAKTTHGFDAYVSEIVATCINQNGYVSAERLTIEIRRRFNDRKMRELTDTPAVGGTRPASGFRSNFVAFKGGHQDIAQKVTEVVIEYHRITQRVGEDVLPNVRKDQIRAEAKQLTSALASAVMSIPLSEVKPLTRDE